MKKWLDDIDINLAIVSPDKPTFNRSKLDHFLVTIEDRPLHSNTPTVVKSFADHDAVTWDFHTSIKWETRTTQLPFDYSKANWDNFEQRVSETIKSGETPKQRNLTNSEIDLEIKGLSEAINTAQEEVIPRRSLFKGGYANIPSELEDLFRARRRIAKAIGREKAKLWPDPARISYLKGIVAALST